MPNPVRIQPIEFNSPPEPPDKSEPIGRPILFKSRFKRLFERQPRTPATEKPVGDCFDEFEPSSVCLTRMVHNFMEESNEKSQQRCDKNRCNCFNGYGSGSSDEETGSSSTDACDVLKRLVPCLFVSERNLLADTAKIVERNRISKRKDGFCRKIVTEDLISLGYNASSCKSKWEKSPSFPAGEFEYVDVLIEGERLIIDIDFRSEFEIARSTKAYKQILQTLPDIFVGKSDRLEKIIDIVTEAAKQSLKKKGMPCPPWRRAGYMKSKWLSPYTRVGGPIPTSLTPSNNNGKTDKKEEASIGKSSSCDDFVLLFGEGCLTLEELNSGGGAVVMTNTNNNNTAENVEGQTLLVKKWEPPEIKPKNLLKGVKIVTGLASVIED